MSTQQADPQDEAGQVQARYARRLPQDPRYQLLDPAAMLAWQERQRALLGLLRRLGRDPTDLRLLEVGCGDGGNLLDLLRIGFQPQHLAGIELLPARCAVARARLPQALALQQGDALALLPQQPLQDIVLQSTVFSSLLDDGFQQALAQAMWAAVKPGGGVLWYDFTVNNPRNADVRGVPLARVRALFPQARLQVQRLTLAPPLARPAARLHPALHGLLHAVPWLRTHVLVWAAKPLAGAVVGQG